MARGSSSARAVAASLVATTLASLVGGAAAGPAEAAPQRPRGIDVSEHQGEIHWRAIPNRQRFAFIKATEGATYRDPTFRRNRRQARRHGLLVGAYHFAYPEGRSRKGARRDGREEARYFIRVAKPRRGELKPVLDLEITNGLPPAHLKPWAKAFVKKVRRRVGTQPIIYTTPHFWRTAMDNTRWFAKRGYKALWVAHWEVRRPNVPAGNWDGRGWTFWQHTDCGQVKGIDGCVDKNRYRYRGFKRVKIR